MPRDDSIVCRFAPSPTGEMHAGNIFASLISWLYAKSHGGKIVLRIEDLDVARSKQEYIDRILYDYERLGLYWDEGPYYQSQNSERYRDAFSQLKNIGRTYPCFCTRADLHASSAPHAGDFRIYSGKCRGIEQDERSRLMATSPYATRLHADETVVSFFDLIYGACTYNVAKECGDFIICRRDGGYSYNLAVVVDDFEENITVVVRGNDLLQVTPQQRYLQNLLDMPQPRYMHVPLIVDGTDRRLSKRNRDATVGEMLVSLKTPQALIGYVARIAGLIDSCVSLWPADLIGLTNWDSLLEKYRTVDSIVWQPPL